MSDPFIDADTLTGYDADEAAVCVAGASAIIRGYCGWHIGPVAEETLTLDGTGSRILALPTLHLTEVAEVTITYAAGDEPTDVTDDVEWSDRGLLRLAGCWPTRWRSITATIAHGYPLEDIADVQAVTRSMCVRLLANPEQVRSQSIAGYAETFAIPALGDAMALAANPVERLVLDRYRLPATP